VLDFFNNDTFSAVSMTRHVNVQPHVPTRIGEMDLFGDRVNGTTIESRMNSAATNGVDSDVVVVTSEDGKLMILPTEARGAMPTYNQPDNVKKRSFQVPHIPKLDELVWDKIIGKRIYGQQANGQTSQESIAAAVDRKLTKIVKEHYLTWEYHRLGALKGVILDADGEQIVYDLFKEFGIQKKTVTYGTMSLAEVSNAIVEHVGDVLGAEQGQGVHCFVGKDFFDAVRDDAAVNTAFERWKEGQHLRTSYQTGMYKMGEAPMNFHYEGVTYERYRGKLNSGSSLIADDKGHAFPIGTDRFFRSNAPGTVQDAVGTLGLPMYIERAPKRFNTGVDFFSQSNPLMMCSQPDLLVELTVE